MSVILRKEYTLEELDEVASTIAGALTDEHVWLVSGQMGAGKTTLTQQVLKHLSTEAFKGSPTFSLINVYHADPEKTMYKKIYHFDLYRLNSLEEAWDLGVEEVWNEKDTLSIIEWPEKAAEILPKKTVSLNIEILSPSARQITIKTDY